MRHLHLIINLQCNILSWLFLLELVLSGLYAYPLVKTQIPQNILQMEKMRGILIYRETWEIWYLH